MKNALFPGATQVIDHISRGLHKIWLASESWTRIGERKRLKAQLTAVNDGETRMNSDTDKIPRIMYALTRKNLLEKTSGK